MLCWELAGHRADFGDNHVTGGYSVEAGGVCICMYVHIWVGKAKRRWGWRGFEMHMHLRP
jgi:hypothetical protein